MSLLACGTEQSIDFEGFIKAVTGLTWKLAIQLYSDVEARNDYDVSPFAAIDDAAGGAQYLDIPKADAIGLF